MARTTEVRLRWASRGIRLAAGIVIVACAIGLFILLERTRPLPARTDAAASAPIAPTIELTRARAPITFTGYGLARAMSAASVSAQVAARIIERPPTIEPGMPIARGDLIIALDDTEFRLQVESAEKLVAATEAELAGLEVQEHSARTQLDLAEAEVALQQRDLDRTREALAQGAGSESEIDVRLTALRRSERQREALQERLSLIPSQRAALESRLAAERAQLDVAREQLSRTRIESPIDGFLQSVAVRPGDLVAPGTLVARIVDPGTLEIPLRLPASAAASAAPGDEAHLWVDGPGDRAWDGRVARIAPDVEPESRSLVVYVEVQQRTGGDVRDLLRPGQFLVGRVSTGESRAGLLVPRRAVQDDAVWVVEPMGDGLGRLVRHQVEVERYLEGEFASIDSRERQWAVLASGPEEGSLIAVGMAGDLQDGQVVRLAEPAGADGDARPAAQPIGARSAEDDDGAAPQGATEAAGAAGGGTRGGRGGGE